MAKRQRCRHCGCTDDRACMTSDGPCYWVIEDTCSACASPALTAQVCCDEIVLLAGDLLEQFPSAGEQLRGVMQHAASAREFIARSATT